MKRQQLDDSFKLLQSLHPVVRGALASVAIGVMSVIALPAVSATLPESSNGGAPEVANGTYVFGDTPESGQPGHEYMVIQIEGDRVMGGFYQPSSEFSCFSGNVTPTELTLQVQETYGDEVATYSVPLYLNNRVAASEFVLPYENALGLQGTHRMDQVDDVSQRVLEACRTGGVR